MKTDEGFWNDFPCINPLPFVCKTKYSSTPLGPVTTTTQQPETDACGHDWVEDLQTGICYRLVQEHFNFVDARLYCNELNYYDGQTVPDLVSLSQSEEQLFVQGALLIYGPRNILSNVVS